MDSQHAQLASTAHKVDAQVRYQHIAERFLQNVNGAFAHCTNTKSMPEAMHATDKYLRRRQSEHREAYAARVMPYVASITDTLVCLACDALAFTEQNEANAESNI